MADIVKLLTKEDVTPVGADRVSFNLAPALSVMQIIMVAAIIPIGAGVVAVNLNVGLLYFVAFSGLAAMGAVDGGLEFQQQECPAGRLPGRGAVAQL